MKEDYQPLDTLRSSYRLQGKTFLSRKCSAREEITDLFAQEENDVSQTAWACCVYSMVPYLGILFIPLTLILGSFGFAVSYRQPHLGGRKLALISVSLSFGIFLIQIFFWWLLYIIPESGTKPLKQRINTDKHGFLKIHLMGKLLYADLTYKIIGSAMKVYNTLGHGFLEKVYENSLMVLLKRAGIKAEQQVPIKVWFEGEIVGDYIADILIEDKIILELKVVDKITNIHKAQVLNYLKATGLEIALIINFGGKSLEHIRLINRLNQSNDTKIDTTWIK